MESVNKLAGMDFVSVDEITPEVMRYIMRQSKILKESIRTGDTNRYKLIENPDVFIGKAFCENSTRTRLSFELAALYAGASIIGFDGPEGTSLKKKESLRDTLEMLAGYRAQAIILRHPLNGSARWAVEVIERRRKRIEKKYGSKIPSIPILNGGDGIHEHPTQLILDRFSVLEKLERLTNNCDHPYSVSGATFLISGDLVYGRVPHSLVKNFSRDGCHFIFVAPEEFQMPETYIHIIDKHGSTYEKYDRLTPEIIAQADFIWGLRFQLERHQGITTTSLEKALRNCRLTLEDLENYAKISARVMHPLPINKEDPEIDPRINDSIFAGYYDAAANGLPTRIVEILISLGLLGHDFDGVIYHPKRQGKIAWKERNAQSQCSKNNFAIQPIQTSGTTIDRLPIDTAIEVMQMLGLNDQGVVYRSGNVRPKSGREEMKGILMIEGWEPTDEDITKIGLVAGREEGASKPLSVNKIQDGQVTRKIDIFAPDVMTFEGQGSCIDDNCISRNRQNEHAITKVVRVGPGKVRCWYCDAMMNTSTLFD